MQISPAIFSACSAIALASSSVCAASARAAARAKLPPEPIATRPSSGSITSPVPETTSEVSASATTSSASSFPKRRSVRQSLASSTAARVSWPCFSSLASNSSNRVKASAAAPAKPASTWPSRPRRRTLRALAFITVLPRVTWPSPATTPRPLRRTETMVVAWKVSGLRLGSMGGSRGLNPPSGDGIAGSQPPVPSLPRAADHGSALRALRFPFGPRVRGVVDLGQVLEVQVGVDLGGGDVGVAEQFLHAAQVARGFEHVAGEGMPQQVRVHALEQTLALCEFAQPQLHRA